MVIDSASSHGQRSGRSDQQPNRQTAREILTAQQGSRSTSVDMLRDESSTSEGTNSGGSTDGTDPSSLNHDDPQPRLPAIADQISQIEAIENRPLAEGERGYVIAKRWIDRVKAHLPEVIQSGTSKVLSQEPLGAVDNTELVSVEFQSATVIQSEGQGALRDENGEAFVKLKEGQLGADFIVIKEESWNLIMKWYGVKDGSPAIVRYIHNSNPSGDIPNLQWELYPPVITAYILRSTEEAISQPQPCLRALGRSSQSYQQFLKSLKSALKIPSEVKVQLWRLLSSLPPPPVPSGIPTPAASRESSPRRSQRTNEVQDKLHLTVERFSALQSGSQRELINIPDESSVATEGGHSVRDAGLGTDVAIVVETQSQGPAGGEWPSNSMSLTSSQTHLPRKQGQSNESGRNTPRSFGALATRGRLRQNGRSVGSCGLSNLGNTCYMNSALQCVRSVEELSRYFLSKSYARELNPSNLLGYGGEVAKAYAKLLDEMYATSIPTSIPPRNFKAVIGRAGPQFSGYQQQDSQEFVGFLLDGLSEDLNRIHKKPYTEKPDSTDEMVSNPAALNEMADKCWDMYKARNDSPVVDLFAGSYKSTLVCPVCDKVSITFDPFTNLTLQLPVPNLWSYRVKYYPAFDPPIHVEIDIPKSGSIFDLKCFIASRVKTDPQRLFGAEVWKSKVFKTYPDQRAVTEEIRTETNDQPVFWELDEIPAVHSKSTKKKSMLLVDEDETISRSAPSDNIIVPVYMRHQVIKNTRHPYHMFGEPFYMLINQDQANDIGALRRKLLAKISTFTSNYLMKFDEDDNDMYSDAKEVASSSSTEGSGVMVDAMDTAADSPDDPPSDKEVEFVDVPTGEPTVDRQMAEFLDRINNKPINAPTPLHPSVRPILDPVRPLPRQIESLFVMKYFSARSDGVPTGWNAMTETDEYTDISTRIPRVEETAEDSDESDAQSDQEGSDDSTEELQSTADQASHSFVHSIEDESALNADLPPLEEVMASKADRRNKFHANRARDAKKGLNRLVKPRGISSRLRSLGRRKPPPPESGPLIRLGECLVLDWYEDTYEQYFGTRHLSDGRGMLITDDEHCNVLPDPELELQRRTRKARAKNGISLDDCLDAFGKEEILAAGDEWYCPRCKEHRRASKKFELWRTPDILIIHLKRFSSTSRRDKLDIMVEFPTEELDLTTRVRKQIDGRSEIYDLFGVDNHYGGLGGGHYTAFARNWVDGQWNDYNDSVVTRTEAHHVVTPSAYLLFYRRRSASPLGGPLFESICEKDFADAEAAVVSRNLSPSGDGHPLGGSRSGLSSGLQVADRIPAVTGKEVILRDGIYGGVNDPPTPPSPEYGPPNYGDGNLADGEQSLEPTTLDIDGGYTGNTWSWGTGAGLGRATSQMAAMPPEDEDDDENLMDDASSMRVGGRASPSSMDAGDDWQGSRVSSPEVEEMEVKEPDDPRELSPAVAEVHVEEGEGLVSRP